jgi:hypothetical protein
VAGHRMAVHHAQAWAHREAMAQLGEDRRVVRNHQGADHPADFPVPGRLGQPAHRPGARCSAQRLRSARSQAGPPAQHPADQVAQGRPPAQVPQVDAHRFARWPTRSWGPMPRNRWCWSGRGQACQADLVRRRWLGRSRACPMDRPRWWGGCLVAQGRLLAQSRWSGGRRSVQWGRLAQSRRDLTGRSPDGRRPAQVFPWAQHQSDQSHLDQSQSGRGQSGRSRWVGGRRVVRWCPPGRSRACLLPLAPAGHRTVPACLAGWTRRTVPAARSAYHLAGPGQPARLGDEPWQGECPQAGQSGEADLLPDQPVACPQAGSLA